MHTYAILLLLHGMLRVLQIADKHRSILRRFAHKTRVNLPSPAIPGHVGGYPATHPHERRIDYVVLREKNLLIFELE